MGYSTDKPKQLRLFSAWRWNAMEITGTVNHLQMDKNFHGHVFHCQRLYGFELEI